MPIVTHERAGAGAVLGAGGAPCHHHRLLMDASGRDLVLLETVGVGQAEVDIVDHAVAELLDRVAACELDPASAAATILERERERGTRHRLSTGRRQRAARPVAH